MKGKFKEKVQNAVMTIPKGHVMTYKEVAKMTGNIRAARAVASIMAANFNPDIPCHRVIRSDGKLGGYNRGGTQGKRAILRAEGYIN
jgi:O-6-methylguanine DNA methyltransferase